MWDISPAEKDKYRAIYESLQPADGKLSGDQVLGSSFVYNFWAFENLSTKYRIKNRCSFKSAAQPVCLLRILFLETEHADFHENSTHLEILRYFFSRNS